MLTFNSIYFLALAVMEVMEGKIQEQIALQKAALPRAAVAGKS